MSRFLRPYIAALHANSQFAKIGVWPPDSDFSKFNAQLKPFLGEKNSVSIEDIQKIQGSTPALVTPANLKAILSTNVPQTSGGTPNTTPRTGLTPDEQKKPAVANGIGTKPDERFTSPGNQIGNPAEPPKPSGVKPFTIDPRYVAGADDPTNLNAMYGKNGLLSELYALPGGNETKPKNPPQPTPPPTPGKK